ncbi:MAG TPA: VOC family protein [Burkholderiales bacterium]|nr:VOC family protein [Burkholderiales bacterium]
MASVPRLSFSHFGMFVTDVARMEDFYTRVLGFAVTDHGDLETPRGAVRLVFLSRDPRDHHQIVLVSGRPEGLNFNPINQISFRMDELAGLREMHRRLQRERVKEMYPVSHGNALSVYFHDPEGNRVELFIDTPWHCHQPVRMPLDLELSDEALWRAVETEARKQPDFKPIEAWRAEVARRITDS